MMKNLLIILVIVSVISCGAGGDAPRLSDQENIQGMWLAQTESVNGIKREVDFQYIFKEDTLTFIDETGMEVKYSFRLDTSSKPKFIVIQPADAPTNSTPVNVGYELDSNSLKIVVAPAGLSPTEISDNNDQELIICKRKGS